MSDEAYALTLSVESDAVLLARRARDDGMRSIAAVTSDAPLQRRFKAAFAATWEREGGAAARDYRFDASPEVLGLLRRELSARPSDATLLCVAPGDAALGKSFLPPGRVYASSQIADGLSTQMLRDLGHPAAEGKEVYDVTYENVHHLGAGRFSGSELLNLSRRWSLNRCRCMWGAALLPTDIANGDCKSSAEHQPMGCSARFQNRLFICLHWCLLESSLGT